MYFLLLDFDHEYAGQGTSGATRAADVDSQQQQKQLGRPDADVSDAEAAFIAVLSSMAQHAQMKGSRTASLAGGFLFLVAMHEVPGVSSRSICGALAEVSRMAQHAQTKCRGTASGQVTPW